MEISLLKCDILVGMYLIWLHDFHVEKKKIIFLRKKKSEKRGNMIENVGKNEKQIGKKIKKNEKKMIKRKLLFVGC